MTFSRTAFRRLAATAAAAAGLAAVPAPASADGPVGLRTLLDQRVTAEAAERRDCLDRAPAGARGVVQRRVEVPGSGIVAGRLQAASGDWDLALFDVRTGRRITGSAGFNATEVATGYAGGGREVVVQACRRHGRAATAQLTVTAIPVPQGTAESRPALVKVLTPTAADKRRLVALGLDVTEHAGHDYVEVVAYGDRDLGRLRAASFDFSVVVRDLVAQARADRAADRAFAARTERSALPSGRDAYRTLAEYEADLKRLAEQHPTLVKPLTLRFKTVEGREVHGIEITENAKAADGKPVFLQMGIHHAREWPSGEHALEFGIDLVNGFGKDERITRLVKATRTIVVPVVNPDGFAVSRDAPVDFLTDPQYQQLADSVPLFDTANYLADPAGAYKRRNCRLAPGATQPPGACAAPSNRALGTDPNRNYGGLWGGPGASALPAYDTYRGAGPFSEPETQNVRDLVSRRQVTTLITNHTFSNLVLRPPGVRAQGPPPDEGIYADLGARMAAQNGYLNQPSYGLYDTTGTTEDWTYYATGGLGYTFEIGPGEGEGSGFHPPFQYTVQQYVDGSNGAGGNREAYLIALENTADATKHATLTGRAPAGATLRLKKEFVTETSPVRPAEDDVVSGPNAQIQGDRIRFTDTLDTTTTVGRDGTFRWAVNPSTRPSVAENRYTPIADKPTREQRFEREKETTPTGGAGAYEEANFEEKTFTLTEADKAFTMLVNLRGEAADDYDIVLYRRGEGGKLEEVGSSGNLPGSEETIVVEAPAPGEYVLRVNNYLAFLPYEGEFQVFGPGQEVVKAGTTEAWTLTCEVGGTVLGSQKVVVGRGQTKAVPAPCGANAAAVAAAVRAARERRASASCATSAGFAATRVRPLAQGRRVRFEFSRRVPAAARIDVFQVATGGRVLGERRVATFRGLRRSMTWDGRGNDGKAIRDGVFFVRYQIKGARTRTDVRRATLVRRNGRFAVRSTFYRPDSCGLLASAKLERPVFGGRTNRPLNVAFRVARTADVTVTVRRGKRVVRTVRTRNRQARRTHRLRLPAERLRARGAYRVTITARSGGRTATTTLVSQRL
jgi:hypothetical protein